MAFPLSPLAVPTSEPGVQKKPGQRGLDCAGKAEAEAQCQMQSCGCIPTINVKDATSGNIIQNVTVTYTISSLGLTGEDGSLRLDNTDMSLSINIIQYGYESVNEVINFGTCSSCASCDSPVDIVMKPIW